MPEAFGVFIAAFPVFAVFWCYQFIQLMLLADTDFPGKYDKILWVLAFLAMFFVAPFAFVYWKKAYLVMRNLQKNTKKDRIV